MAKKRPSKLSSRQESALKRHSKHHSNEHMNAMKRHMLSGLTFGEAHKKAQAKVGR